MSNSVEDNGGVPNPIELSSSWNYKYEPNQLFPELANVLSLSPFDGTVSASRKQMFGGSHTSQSLVVEKPTPRRIQTGAEMEYGAATFSTKVERHSTVIAIIPYYNDKSIGIEAIRRNPENLVVLEYQDNGEIDCVSMKEYFSNHQYFGFRYKNTELGRKLHTGMDLPPGAILQDSPSKTPDGQYAYGINLNTIYGSFPEVAEDGIIISDEIVPWLTIKRFERRTVAYGSSHFPINLYGDKDTYKPFPDIGDYVREDGLLMAVREYNPDYSAVEMSFSAVSEINYNSDRLTYIPSGRARVIDVRVKHDSSRTVYSPSVCNDQALKYDRASRSYYREIYKLYERMRRNKGGALKISHHFKNVVKDAYSVIQEEYAGKDIERVQKIYRAAPMDDFTIEFVIEMVQEPTVGFKLTDCYGGKGVVVKVVPAEDMPVDAMGNRAQIIMAEEATLARQNPGRLYEQFYNASSRDLTKEICALFNITPPHTHGQKLTLADKMRVESAFKTKDPKVLAMWDRFVRYFSVVVPKQGEFYKQEAELGFQHEHLITVMETGIWLHHPSDNDPELPDVLDILVEEFMPFMGPVTYRGNSGKMVTTRKNFLIGETYFLQLEKTGDEWTSVSSGKLQSFGILSHLTTADRHASPWRQQAIRAWGETETAIAVSYMGGLVMSEIMDRSNNISSHRYAVYNILKSPQPTNISQLIDRKLIPLGDSRPVDLVKHLCRCNGFEFIYTPYVETEPKPTAIEFVI